MEYQAQLDRETAKVKSQADVSCGQEIFLLFVGRTRGQTNTFVLLATISVNHL